MLRHLKALACGHREHEDQQHSQGAGAAPVRSGAPATRLARPMPLDSFERMVNTVYAVHATDYEPRGGVIRVADPAPGSRPFAPDTHFALGDLVHPHGQFTWDTKSYAVIAPLRALVPQLVSVQTYDTFIVGDFTLPPDALVLYRRDMPKPQWTGATKRFAKAKLRAVVRHSLRERSSWSATMRKDHGFYPANVAVGPGGENVNTPSYFAPLLERLPHVAFGMHSNSLQGNAYLRGIVHNCLSGWDAGSDNWGPYWRLPGFSRRLVGHCLRELKTIKHPTAPEAANAILATHVAHAEQVLAGLRVTPQQELSDNSFYGDFFRAFCSMALPPAVFAQLLDEEDAGSPKSNRDVCGAVHAAYRMFYSKQSMAQHERHIARIRHAADNMPAPLRIQTIASLVSDLCKRVLQSQTQSVNTAPLLGCLYGLLTPAITGLLPKNTVSRAARITQQWQSTSTSDAESTNLAPNLPLRVAWRYQESSDIIPAALTSARLWWDLWKMETPDGYANVPVVAAINRRDDAGAASLVRAGVRIKDVRANVIGYEQDPLLSFAIKLGAQQTALALLQRPDFAAYGTPDHLGHVPLADALALQQEQVVHALLARLDAT